MYNYRRGDYGKINEELSNINWTDLFSNTDIENAVQLFYNKLYSLRDKYIPTRTIKSKNVFPPWYSKELIKIIKEKFKFHSKYKNYGNLSDKNEFERLRDLAIDIEKHCHTLYLSKIENSLASNSNTFWSFMKSKSKRSSIPSCMTYLNRSCDSGKDICDLFSDYFYSNFLYSNSTTSHTTNVTMSQSNLLTGTNDISSVEIREDRVYKMLQSLDLKKSAGPDLLPALLLVNCSKTLSIPVTLLFKRSLHESSVPNIWKSAFVSPIHKKGSRNKVDNYRPISKLCLLAKVFERLVYDQLYFSLKSYFSPSQHGFLKGKSTVSNLIVFTEFVSENMDSHNQVDAIYTDYSKAFDRIDHELLLRKLFAAGIRGDLFRWFSSYVRNRSQAVVLNGFISSWRNVPSGVPQGSLLGPLLFTIFIRDIDTCFENSEFLLFADDMKIFRGVNNITDQILLQDDLIRLDNYCNINKLDLNVSKCCTISFTRKRNIFESKYTLKNQELC